MTRVRNAPRDLDEVGLHDEVGGVREAEVRGGKTVARLRNDFRGKLNGAGVRDYRNINCENIGGIETSHLAWHCEQALRRTDWGKVVMLCQELLRRGDNTDPGRTHRVLSRAYRMQGHYGLSRRHANEAHMASMPSE